MHGLPNEQDIAQGKTGGDSAYKQCAKNLFQDVGTGCNNTAIMANFTPSNLVKAQALLTEKFTKNEMREKALPALTLALKNSNILLPSANQIRTREDRAVEAYVMKRNKRNPTAARTHNHTGNRGDSFAVPLTWSTYSDVFSLSLKQMDNNIFSFNQALAQGFADCVMNIRGDVETDNIAFLLAQRSQINIATERGTFNAANDAFEIALADKPQFYQIVENMMAANNYTGRYDVIASQGVYIDGNWYAAQGSANANNSAFQFTNMNIARSTELTDANYAGGVALVMPEAGFGVIPWIPKQNRQGEGDYNTYVGGYGSITDGDIDVANPDATVLTYAVHGYRQRADTSASNGSTQDDIIEFEVSVDIARVLSPLSTATESVVFEVGQLTA